MAARLRSLLAALPLPLLLSGPVLAGGVPANITELTVEDLRATVIALVNLTTAPGVDGAVFDFGGERRDSELERASLLFSSEFTLRDTVLDGFWTAGLSHGRVNERLRFDSPSGTPLDFNAERTALSLQVGGGLVLPLDQHLRLRGFGSTSLTRLENETRLRAADLGEDTVATQEYFIEWDADAATLAATGEVIYDRWYERGLRLELEGSYTVAWTDTISTSQPGVNGESWHDTFLMRARVTGPTGRTSRGRPWRWLGYAQYVNFVGQPTAALGFRYYSELGVGVLNEWNIKPLNWFGVRNIGFKLGLIRGENLQGFSVGLIAR